MEHLLPAKYYHIYNHAIGSENLFRSDENYYYFLKKYALHISPIADTYAYCLLPNHFHLLIQIKDVDSLIKTFPTRHMRLGKEDKNRLIPINHYVHRILKPASDFLYWFAY